MEPLCAQELKIIRKEKFSSKPENAIDGYVRNMYGELTHRWLAPMTDEGAWIELAWDAPQRVRHVQLTFDTGFHRELTLTSADSHNKKIIRAPQPECVRDYRILVKTPEGREVEVANVSANHQRLRRHDFEPLNAQSIRIAISATNGSDTARIYEMRCYG